jgi:hypothetical protein
MSENPDMGHPNIYGQNSATRRSTQNLRIPPFVWSSVASMANPFNVDCSIRRDFTASFNCLRLSPLNSAGSLRPGSPHCIIARWPMFNVNFPLCHLWPPYVLWVDA